MTGWRDGCLTTESTEDTEVVGGGVAADFADDADGEGQSGMLDWIISRLT